MYLKQTPAGRNPHILTLSPPLNMDSKWFAAHTAYTMAKYGMSMCVLGMSAEFKVLSSLLFSLSLSASRFLHPLHISNSAVIPLLTG